MSDSSDSEDETTTVPPRRNSSSESSYDEEEIEKDEVKQEATETDDKKVETLVQAGIRFLSMHFARYKLRSKSIFLHAFVLGK